MDATSFPQFTDSQIESLFPANFLDLICLSPVFNARSYILNSMEDVVPSPAPQLLSIKKIEDSRTVYYVHDIRYNKPNNIVLYGLDILSHKYVIETLIKVSMDLETSCIVAYSPLAGYPTYRLCCNKFTWFAAQEFCDRSCTSVACKSVGLSV